jgi:hypothetical protein
MGLKRATQLGDHRRPLTEMLRGSQSSPGVPSRSDLEHEEKPARVRWLIASAPFHFTRRQSARGFRLSLHETAITESHPRSTYGTRFGSEPLRPPSQDRISSIAVLISSELFLCQCGFRLKRNRSLPTEKSIRVSWIDGTGSAQMYRFHPRRRVPPPAQRSLMIN